MTHRYSLRPALIPKKGGHRVCLGARRFGKDLAQQRKREPQDSNRERQVRLCNCEASTRRETIRSPVTNAGVHRSYKRSDCTDPNPPCGVGEILAMDHNRHRCCCDYGCDLDRQTRNAFLIHRLTCDVHRRKARARGPNAAARVRGDARGAMAAFAKCWRHQ
jgi:hypothetical protein